MAETTISLAYKVGDLVALRSGGEVMTVNGYNMSGVECVWHDDDGLPHRESYKEGALEAVTPSEKGVTFDLDPGR